MKYLVRMTDAEYRTFRLYTSKVQGFDPNTSREFNSDFRNQEAEDWLLATGKIELRKRAADTRGREYNDAYLVIKGSEEYINNVLEILYTFVYPEDVAPYRGKNTILRNRNLPNRIIREV